MLIPALALAALALMPQPAPDTTTIRAGLVIDRSTTLRRGAYRIQSAGLDTPVLTIRGSNIDLDLSGVELIGSPETATPDQYKSFSQAQSTVHLVVGAHHHAGLALQDGDFEGQEIGFAHDALAQLHVADVPSGLLIIEGIVFDVADDLLALQPLDERLSRQPDVG